MTVIPLSERRTSGHLWSLASFEEQASAFLRRLAYRPYLPTVALILLCCVLYLPGIATLPVTDRDEARFAQASKQMLETGDFVDIRFQDEPRYKKPIGIYWLQSAAVTIARKLGAALDDIWAYRVPSFLAALSAVLLLYWSSRPLVGRINALAAAALFASCLMLAFEARIAKSDAALLASIVLAQGALFRLYMAPKEWPTRGLAALFWVGIGVGVLIKGPVAPALSLFTGAVLLFRDRSRAWIGRLHWGWGVPLLLAITIPWFVAIGLASKGEFFRSSLGQDFAAKLQSGQEQHWAPPGFYFLAFWGTFWPATLFATAFAARALWQARRSRRVLFLLAWIVPFWIVIEATPTKLPHYALPLYPAIAMALVLATRNAWASDWLGSRLNAVLWCAIAILQIAILLVPSWIAGAPQIGLIFLLATLFAAVATLTAVAAWSARWHVAFFAALLSGAVFYPAAFRFALPALEPIWLSESASAAASALRVCTVLPVGFAGFSAPSVIFRNGTKTLLAPPASLADALASEKIGLAFVNSDRHADFEASFLARTGTGARFLGCVDGVDINGRGPTRLQLYARPDAPASCTPVPTTECREQGTVRWRRILRSKF